MRIFQHFQKWSNLYIAMLLVIYFGYHFKQYYHQPLDGDMPGVILPTRNYQQVLADPLGIQVWTQGKKYAATNRFSLHWSMRTYYNSVPFFLQKVVTPIQSVYLSNAIFKITLHVFLLWLLASYVTVNRPEQRWLAMLIMAPLFQSGSYSNYMGIICASPTYTFFYAFPLTLLLWWFLPFFQKLKRQELPQFGWLTTCWSIVLLLFLAFCGPLVPPLILLLAPFVGFVIWKKYQSLPMAWRWWIGGSTILALYSFYLSQYNLENSAALVLVKRYQLLGIGIFKQLTGKLGFSLLLLVVLVNGWLKQKNRQVPFRFQNFGFLLLIFSVIYIILLPLGGYREYRPFLIHFDTIMPVTLGLVLYFGNTTLDLLEEWMTKNKRKKYSAYLIMVSIVFLVGNEPRFTANACETAALEKIAEAEEGPVLLDENCQVLSWIIFADPGYSQSKAALLYRWNITDQPRLFYFR